MNLSEKTEFLVVATIAVLAGLRFPLSRIKNSWLRENRQFFLIAIWLLDGIFFFACFRHSEGVSEYCATLLEIVGVTLLGREVWFAQRIEEIRDRISRQPQAALRKTEEAALELIPAIESRRRWLFSGLALVAGSLVFHTMFTKMEPPPSKRLNVFKFKKTIRFGTGIFALKVPGELSKDVPSVQEDLTPVVCSAKDELLKAGTNLAIVIGRHDSMPMKRRATISNLDIAQQRAEAVATVLNDANSCGSGTIPNLITLSRSPATPDSVRSEDREVSILGIGEALEK
jgi:hypothetical protein